MYETWIILPVPVLFNVTFTQRLLDDCANHHIPYLTRGGTWVIGIGNCSTNIHLMLHFHSGHCRLDRGGVQQTAPDPGGQSWIPGPVTGGPACVTASIAVQMTGALYCCAEST